MADETPQEQQPEEPVVTAVVSDVPAVGTDIAPPLPAYIDGLKLTTTVQQLHEDLTLSTHGPGNVPTSIPQDGVLGLLIVGAIEVPLQPEPEPEPEPEELDPEPIVPVEVATDTPPPSPPETQVS